MNIVNVCRECGERAEDGNNMCHPSAIVESIVQPKPRFSPGTRINVWRDSDSLRLQRGTTGRVLAVGGGLITAQFGASEERVALAADHPDIRPEHPALATMRDIARRFECTIMTDLEIHDTSMLDTKDYDMPFAWVVWRTGVILGTHLTFAQTQRVRKQGPAAAIQGDGVADAKHFLWDGSEFIACLSAADLDGQFAIIERRLRDAAHTDR